MQAIAEFAMRSRAHAIGLSMMGGALPLLGWLSTIIVALVCLRQGFAAGSLVLLWTLLPYGVAFYFVGDPSPAIVLVGTFLLAALLRQTLSWELVLITVVLVAGLGTVVVELTSTGLVTSLSEIYTSYFRQVNPEVVLLPEQAEIVTLGLIAAILASAMVVMLIVARWSQSSLYNPGGFGKEFHGLRLSPGVGAGAVLLIAVCFAFSEVLGRWVPLLTVPLLFAALGLVHWLMASRQLSNGWVAGFYMILFFFQPLYLFLVGVAVMDSWVDVRNRLKTNQKD